MESQPYTEGAADAHLVNAALGLTARADDDGPASRVATVGP